ncbi:MAG: DUF4105 domain-containing protein [Bacteroidales bacterium]|nr:DUF4105 domain-containing protein [Bacteroidales bacterium]
MKAYFSQTQLRRIGIGIIMILHAAIWCMANAQATDAPRFSLITCAPGKEIYQLEGHEALRIRMGGGIDLAVNWGLFDFNSPNFLYRFVKGETDYMAGAYPFAIFLEEYEKEGRRVVEQEINLTPRQASRLLALVEENLLTENRTYRYNYVKDNCATRPFELIERAAGTPVIFTEADTVAANTSFRSEMTRYHKNYPWYQFGIDMALGSGIDYNITQRERIFAPVELERALDDAYFLMPDGNRIPVVTKSAILLPGPEEGVAEGPTPLLLTPVAAGWYLLLLTIAVSIPDLRRHRLSRWFDSTLYGIQFLAGCLLTFLIFISVHEATSPNWLYLWLNPLCALPAIGIWIKSWKRVVYWYQICNFAALTVLLSAHSLLGQALNAAFPLFILCALIRSAIEIYMLHPRHTSDIMKRKK